MQLLGTDLPIIQAPMAGAQGVALAAAVCNAGGLGSLPCAMITPEAMGSELEMLSERAPGRPYNVNFFCHTAPVADSARQAAWRQTLAPYYREFGIDPDKIQASPGRAPFDTAYADVLETFRPPIVSFHFGLPQRELLARVKSSGAKVFSSATTVEEALWLEREGADAIIAQGNEAGGHRGMFLSADINTQIGTFALLPQIVRAVRLPVIAAGGIADAAGVKAALALGAAAVQPGTAFLLCPESTIGAVHRAALKDAAAATALSTALTNLFTGRPARGIVNRFMRELGPMNGAVPQFPLATAAIAPIRAAAEARGSGDFSPLWCGQNATGCREISAGEVIRQLAA